MAQVNTLDSKDTKMNKQKITTYLVKAVKLFKTQKRPGERVINCQGENWDRERLHRRTLSPKLGFDR